MRGIATFFDQAPGAAHSLRRDHAQRAGHFLGLLQRLLPQRHGALAHAADLGANRQAGDAHGHQDLAPLDAGRRHFGHDRRATADQHLFHRSARIARNQPNVSGIMRFTQRGNLRVSYSVTIGVTDVRVNSPNMFFISRTV